MGRDVNNAAARPTSEMHSGGRNKIVVSGHVRRNQRVSDFAVGRFEDRVRPLKPLAWPGRRDWRIILPPIFFALVRLMP